MFPSAGYFRSANCPFFVHGLCHRPYCHFKHAKPETQSTLKKPPVFTGPKSKLSLGVSRLNDGSGPFSTSPLYVEKAPSTSGVPAVSGKTALKSSPESAVKTLVVPPVEPDNPPDNKIELNVKSSKVNEAESLLLSYCDSKIDLASDGKSTECDKKEEIKSDKALSSCSGEKESSVCDSGLTKETKCSEVVDNNQRITKTEGDIESNLPCSSGSTGSGNVSNTENTEQTGRCENEIDSTEKDRTKSPQVQKKISKLKSATKRMKVKSGSEETANRSGESSDEDEMTKSEAACVKKSEKLIERLLQVLQEESEDLNDVLAEKVKRKLLKKEKNGTKKKEKEKDKQELKGKNNEGDVETEDASGQSEESGKKKVREKRNERLSNEENKIVGSNDKESCGDVEKKGKECPSFKNKKRDKSKDSVDEDEGLKVKKEISRKGSVSDDEKKKIKSKNFSSKEGKKKETPETVSEDEHSDQKKMKPKELLIIKSDEETEVMDSKGKIFKDGRKTILKDSLCKDKNKEEEEDGITKGVMKEDVKDITKNEITQSEHLLVDYSLTDDSDADKGNESAVKKEKEKKTKEFFIKEKSLGSESAKRKSKVQLSDIDFTKGSKKSKEKTKGQEKSSSREKEKCLASKSSGMVKQKTKLSGTKKSEKKQKQKQKLKTVETTSKINASDSEKKPLKSQNECNVNSKGIRTDVTKRKHLESAYEKPSSSSSSSSRSTDVGNKKLKQTEESDEVDSDEDHFDDPDFADEEELLRIFNEASQGKDSSDVQQTVPAPMLINPVVPAAVKRSSSADSSVNIPTKKKRIAHEPKYLVQKVSSSMSASPQKRLPKTLSREVTSTTSSTPSSSSAEGSSLGKRRIAHTGKSNSSDFRIMVRPKIPLEYGAKVPQNIRQRYLDKIIDEYLIMFGSEQQAYKKAMEEEKSIYIRSTRRQLYMNLCTHLIKRLRESVTNSPTACTATISEPGTSSPISPEKRNPLAPKRFLFSPPRIAKLLPLEIAETDETPNEDLVMGPQTQQDPNCLPEADFFEGLRQYLLREDDLIDNGYPRPSDVPGKASIKRTIHSKKSSRSNSDSTRRTCARCGKPFVILEGGEYLLKEECSYHWGRLWKRRVAGEITSSYSCCQGDAGSSGCCVSKVHVPENVEDDLGYMTTIFNPLANTKSKKVYSLDCEMCYTAKGLELTRVTVVDFNLKMVYDTFVKPDQPIMDYNTRFSGITEENMFDVSTTLREVQAVLLSFIHKDTILIGHSLESDLIALKLIHSQIVDTAIVFPHRLGPPYKRALRNLMGEYLHKIIQDSVDGHDSLEDASSCVELMLWKVKEDLKKKMKQKK